MDSPATIDAILKEIKAKDQVGCALTDHGTMNNISAWYVECKKRGIKPILGNEAYVQKNGIQDLESVKQARTNSALAIESGNLGISHLILLAKNYVGYQNLCRITAVAHTEGYYYQPRIDYDILEKYKEGLIVSTACMFGDFSKMLERGLLKEAREFAGRMKSIFGNDFYIEIQNHGFDTQAQVIPLAVGVAKALDIPLVVSQDAHYAKPEHWKFQDALFCMGAKAKWVDEDRRTACREMYIKSRSQLEAMFSKFNVPASAFDNTMAILERVENYELAPKDWLLPKFFPDAQTSKTVLREKCREGWKRRLISIVKDNPALKKIYADRVDYELNVINSMGFADYFLIVVDFLDWARSQKIPIGPGRGSVCGSLVAYLLNITETDPVKYNLLFERFLVEGRPSLPDIDVDVTDRDAILHYLEGKYGKDRVAPILNRATLGSKGALGKVASILGNHKLGLEISKLIPSDRGKTPSFEQAYRDIPALNVQKASNPELFELAEGLEGVTTHVSGHASGVIVSSVPITDVAPLQRAESQVYVAYDKKQSSYVKLVKMDILGLDILKTLWGTLKLVKDRYGEDIDLYSLPHNDPAAFKLLANGDTVGIFQFESPVVRKMFKEIQPVCMDDISAVNALNRPGPLDSGIDKEYLKRKQDSSHIVYPHPLLEPVLKETYGLMIYQEQLLAMAGIMANYDVRERDSLRKAISDKKEEDIEKHRGQFIERSIKNSFPAPMVTSIFEQMKNAGSYMFNKSHAVGYAYLAYLCAYLKTRYPLEFLVSCLNTQLQAETKPELAEITKFVIDIEAHGTQVHAPDVTKSQSLFHIEYGLDNKDKPVVYYALGAVKSVSPDAVGIWLAKRPFTSLDDCVLKGVQSGVSSAQLQVLAEIGAFASLAPNVSYTIKTMEDRIGMAKKLMARVKRQQKKEVIEQGELLTVPAEITLNMGDQVELSGVSKGGGSARLKAEMEYIGFTLSGTLLDPYVNQVRAKSDALPSYFIQQVLDGDNCRVAGVIQKLIKRPDRNGNMMAFFELSDGRVGARALVFSSTFKQFADATWRNGRAVVVDGRKDGDALIASDVRFLFKEGSDQDEEKKTKQPKIKDQTDLGEGPGF